MKCANHPKAPFDAVSKCISCGKPICDECRVTSKKLDYCVRCFCQKNASFIERHEGPPKNKEKRSALQFEL